MIVEITTELLVEMFRSDNVIHVVVKDGIPQEYQLTHTKVTENGTIALLLETEDDHSLDRKDIVLTDLTGT